MPLVRVFLSCNHHLFNYEYADDIALHPETISWERKRPHFFFFFKIFSLFFAFYNRDVLMEIDRREVQ